MAWTDSCKIAFKVAAIGLVTKQGKRKNITKVLKQLGHDTGIPYKTLRRWYYEKENGLNNETTPETN